MGFLKKMFGGKADPNTNMNLNTNVFLRIRDDAVLQVVGEAYRQDNVALARSPSQEDLPPGLPAPPPGYFKAMLFQEWNNQYDSNAIAVLLWAGHQWAISGYLSRTDAVRYQPLFKYLAIGSATQPAIACDAALVSEGGGKGVVLHLGSPGECAAELVTDDRLPADHPWKGKFIALTGQGRTTIYGVPLDRNAQTMLVKWAGCDLLPRLTKKTDLLVVADPNEVTGNLQRAKEYGVEAIPETDFLVQVGLPAEAVNRVSGQWALG
jgi:hypothetical protein